MNARCLIPGCDNMTAPRGFCEAHWHRMPEDLRERFKWVVRDRGTTIEMAATLRAIAEEAAGEDL